ncbi:hypothetical protein D3C80_955030 [compost metagenome]
MGLLFSSSHRVFHQKGDGHRADTAGHWSDGRDQGQGTVKVDITDQAALAILVNAVNTDIDHHRAGFEPAGIDHSWTANGGDDNIGLTAQVFGVNTARMHHCYRAMRLEQQSGHGLTNDVRAADDYRMFTAEVTADIFQ